MTNTQDFTAVVFTTNFDKMQVQESRVIAVDRYFLNSYGDTCANVKVQFSDGSIGVTVKNLDSIFIDETRTWKSLFNELADPHDRSALVEFLEFYGVDIDEPFGPSELDLWATWRNAA